MTLGEVANKYGTDKGDRFHRCHRYIDVYEEVLQGLPADLKLLEIGLWDTRFPGASVRMWREFLPRARLFGFDIERATKRLEAEVRMRVFLVNQADAVGQHRAMAAIGPIDLVIDDGSHVLSHINTSLRVIWPHVNSGGSYFIEDLHCAQSQPRTDLDLVVSGELRNVASRTWHRDKKLLVLKKI
jgi:hypothetical protein